MEVDESKPRSLGESNHACWGENVEGFQERVKEILEEIEQDRNFTEMTAEIYDDKKTYLTRNLTELSRMHRALADQYARLIEEVCRICPSLIKKQHIDSSDSSTVRKPIRYDIHLSPNGGGFYLSKRKGSDSGSDSFTSIKKLLIPPVIDNKVKETKPAEVLAKKSSNLEEELVSLNKKIQSLADENTKLKHEIQEKDSDIQSHQKEIRTQASHLETEKAKFIELQKEVADLKDVISGSNLEINTMGEELKVSEELNMEINQYISEISQLKSTHEAREDDWKAVCARLKMELKEKCDSVDDLNEILGSLMLEKDGVTAKLDTLRSDKNFQGLTDENTNLKNEIRENESDKQVADLKLVISDCNLKIETMFDETRWLEGQLGSTKHEMGLLQKLLDSEKDKNLGLLEEVSSCDDQITELNSKLNQSMSEISLLKTTLVSNEDTWNTVIERLKMEISEKSQSVQELETRLNILQADYVGVVSSFDNAKKVTNELTERVLELESELEKGDSVDDLNKKLEANAQLETLQAEKCSQENLIQELETRLHILQADYAGVVSSFDNAKKVTNELTERVLELEREVDMQKEVISVRGDQKEDTLITENVRLKMEIQEKCGSVDDLNNRLEALMFEKNGVISQRDALRAEKSFLDNLIQEQDMRSKSKSVGVYSSFDKIQKLTKELEKLTGKVNQKVVELEEEVDRQREVISDTA